MAPLVTGLHMTVCSFELAIYYAHQQCPLCSNSGIEECIVQGIPLIWNQGNLSVAKQILEPQRFLDPAVVLTEKAQATSIILLLGVGSFICYKIFHHFRHRLNKRHKFNSKLLKKLEFSQWLSNELITKDISPDVECIEEKYFGPDNLGESDKQSYNSDFPQFSDIEDYTSTWEDKESPSDSQHLSDSEEIMGTSASNHSIPVFYNKASGVFFSNFPRSDQHEDVHNVQNMGNPMHDPCSNSPLPFHPVNFEAVKPRHSPRRNIHSGDKQNDLNIPVSHNSPERSLEFPCGYCEGSYEDKQSSEDNMMHEISSQSLWDFQFQDQDSLSLSYDLFSCDNSIHSQDTGSLKAAFSPESLKERYFKAQPFFLCLEKSPDISQDKQFSSENSLDLEISPEYHSQHIKRENSSNDSISSFSDNLFVRSMNTKKLVQYDYSDSETCDSCLDLHSDVADLNCCTVDQIEQLENQLHEVKQAVLEIDAGIVELKVYETPPKNSWNISAISPSDMEHVSWTGNAKNDVNDVIHHQKLNVCCKQLINTIFCSEKDTNSQNCIISNPKCVLTSDSSSSHCTERLKEVPPDRSAIPLCISSTVFRNSFSDKQNLEVLDSGSDSGSDFGTDFEEASENEEPCSLEWDPTCLPECSSKSEDSQIEELPAAKTEYLKHSLDNNNVSLTIKVPKRKRSSSFTSAIFKQQTLNDASSNSKKNLFQRRMTFPIYNNSMRTNAELLLELSTLYRFSEVNKASAMHARLPATYPFVNHFNSSQVDVLQKEKEKYTDNKKGISSLESKQETESIDNLELYSNQEVGHSCQLCGADNNGNCLETNRHYIANCKTMNIGKNLFSYKENILDNDPHSTDSSFTIFETEETSCRDSQIKSVKRKCSD